MLLIKDEFFIYVSEVALIMVYKSVYCFRM